MDFYRYIVGGGDFSGWRSYNGTPAAAAVTPTCLRSKRLPRIPIRYSPTSASFHMLSQVVVSTEVGPFAGRPFW